MKKNITINLCGRLFAIDEDAYEMLSTYEQSLRNYFRSREGGEEIAEDIEARIAELLDEVKQQGIEAITIEHVREIIHRIGKPEELEEEAPSDSPKGEGTQSLDGQAARNSSPLGEGGKGRRLYRNPDDKKLMGVLSGFAAYFGGDVLWWRLGYAACVLLSFAGSSYNFLWFLPGRYLYFQVYFWGLALIVAYILLAVLMPVAETPEDRLRMKGKEVNPQNLAEEIASPRPTPDPSRQGGETSDSNEDSCAQQRPSLTGAGGGGAAGHRGPSGCVSSTFGCIGGFFSALWLVITTLFRWCLYAFGAFVAVMCLIGIFMLFVVAFGPINDVFSNSFMDSPEFAALLPSLKVPFIIFFVSSILVLVITAYSIIHSLLNEFRLMPSMPYRQRITLLIMWIGGLIIAGSAVGSRWLQFIEAENAYHQRFWREIDERERVENTHDGIYIRSHEWEWLQDNGWKILNAEGCNDRFTTTGQYLNGDRDARYLDCYDDHHRQRYRAERTETLQPGTYRLSCVARANGTGACIYVIVGDEKPQFVEIPAAGNEGGSIWEEAKWIWRVAVNSTDTIYNQHFDEDIVNANHGKGFGWNRITIEPIRLTAPTVIRYGLTSDDVFTGRTWLGQWFSATDFEVSLCEDAANRREAKAPKTQTSEVASPDSSNVQSGRMVIVHRGETLATIARRNHTTVSRLRQLNHLHSNYVRVGQRLRVR